MPSKTGLKLQLIGEDGNAFFILGKASKAMKRARFPQEEIDQYMSEARSGDYNNLLAVTTEWFDVE